jgi:hypothetical protein
MLYPAELLGQFRQPEILKMAGGIAIIKLKGEWKTENGEKHGAWGMRA